MNQTNIVIEEKHLDFCKAFQKIIHLPSSKLDKALGNQESLTAAKEYFANLSAESYDNPIEIANQIAAFCRRSENENLNKLLKKNHLNLNPEGIDNLVTTKRDPDDEALADPENKRNITNEARDICKDIERWAKQERDKNQSEPNDSNSN